MTSTPRTSLVPVAAMLPQAEAAPGSPHVRLAVTAAGRAASNAAGAARLVATSRDPTTLSELADMQIAWMTQVGRINQTLLTSLAEWSRQYSATRSANTVGKVIEQDGNAINGLIAVAVQYATALGTLYEGAQVGFGWWLEQKLSERS
jgi:hypothetical protein